MYAGPKNVFEPDWNFKNSPAGPKKEYFTQLDIKIFTLLFTILQAFHDLQLQSIVS